MQFLNDIIKSIHGFKTVQKFHKFRVLIKTKFMKFLSSFKAMYWFNDVIWKLHPDNNCNFLAPCLVLLMFATLLRFCEQAFSLGGVGFTHSSLKSRNNNTIFNVVLSPLHNFLWTFMIPKYQWNSLTNKSLIPLQLHSIHL